MSRFKTGATGETRSSALWGASSRNGESRSNALWGKGNRSLITVVAAIFLLGVPLAASASDSGGGGSKPTTIAGGLLTYAGAHPGSKLNVIIQSNGGESDAENAVKGLGLGASVRNKLDIVGGVAAEVPAARLAHLQDVAGLTVTPDSYAKTSGKPPFTSTQIWPGETGNATLWAGDASYYRSAMPTIAVVDSGIDTSRVDFNGRVLASANLSTLPNNSPGDGRGHGTFVAGIAAGSYAGNAGASPAANLVSLDVMDDNGKGLTSDIIAACQWILDHKGQYNIKVANFSLHSSAPGNFTNDPLDKAVEKLWFGGVTVVAAAGNYGVNGQPTRVKYAPANDPFVITTGAADLNATVGVGDDKAAPWSTYGYTYDGFRKPEIGAPGRYMVGPIPTGSTLATLKAANLTTLAGYIQLSGTSFAAPVVSGTVAEILARHPSWTPDQVKGALLVTARPTPAAAPGSLGAGELFASRAANYAKTPPNPNKALDQFVRSDPAGGSLPVFNSQAWLSAKADASWDQASYSDASYADASWDVASYADASWDAASYADASYADASYADASYADASYADASYEDSAEGDAASRAAYVLTQDMLTAIAADPLLAAPSGTLIAPSSSTLTSIAP
jgi:serine protease AprX